MGCLQENSNYDKMIYSNEGLLTKYAGTSRTSAKAIY